MNKIFKIIIIFLSCSNLIYSSNQFKLRDLDFNLINLTHTFKLLKGEPSIKNYIESKKLLSKLFENKNFGQIFDSNKHNITEYEFDKSEDAILSSDFGKKIFQLRVTDQEDTECGYHALINSFFILDSLEAEGNKFYEIYPKIISRNFFEKILKDGFKAQIGQACGIQDIQTLYAARDKRIDQDLIKFLPNNYTLISKNIVVPKVYSSKIQYGPFKFNIDTYKQTLISSERTSRTLDSEQIEQLIEDAIISTQFRNGEKDKLLDTIKNINNNFIEKDINITYALLVTTGEANHAIAIILNKFNNEKEYYIVDSLLNYNYKRNNQIVESIKNIISLVNTKNFDETLIRGEILQRLTTIKNSPGISEETILNELKYIKDFIEKEKFNLNNSIVFKEYLPTIKKFLKNVAQKMANYEEYHDINNFFNKY